jgi:hypothetical protein
MRIDWLEVGPTRGGVEWAKKMVGLEDHVRRGTEELKGIGKP